MGWVGQKSGLVSRVRTFPRSIFCAESPFHNFTSPVNRKVDKDRMNIKGSSRYHEFIDWQSVEILFHIEIGKVFVAVGRLEISLDKIRMNRLL